MARSGRPGAPGAKVGASRQRHLQLEASLSRRPRAGWVSGGDHDSSLDRQVLVNWPGARELSRCPLTIVFESWDLLFQMP